MYPSSARLLISSMEEEGFVEARRDDVEESMSSWEQLATTLKARYSLDMNALHAAYRNENADYAYRQVCASAQSAFDAVPPTRLHLVLGPLLLCRPPCARTLRSHRPTPSPIHRVLRMVPLPPTLL